jgi:rhamnose transport system permease protein
MFNKQFFDDLKFKWVYKGDRNIEAKNRNARKEVQQLKEEIAVVYADNSLSSVERNAKVAEIKNKITEVEYTCKTETKAALEELKRSRKAKA